MNLLTEPWIPVRPLPTGAATKITLRRLLCEDSRWELCLPRDDMELAALQMLVCMAQVFFTPKDLGELKQRIVSPLALEAFDAGCESFQDWFRVDHPDYPFMQVRGVIAKKTTPMDKLLAGLTGATNSCFVNEPGLGTCLCGGCAAIALFNQASNAPSFGGGADGGFKAGLRGATPITTLLKGEHLRLAVWLNVLSEDSLSKTLPWYMDTKNAQPTWVDPIKVGEIIPAHKIGLLRGLFWQPAYIELLSPKEKLECSCCGCNETKAYDGFKTNQFGFKVSNTWPHPHSARILDIDSKKVNGKDIREYQLSDRFISFGSSIPAWTQLGRIVVQQLISDARAQGQEPAAVVRQGQRLFKSIHLNIGGYRNNQASILERRHELIFLNDGWSNHTNIINDLVGMATGYRDALYKALGVFGKGIKKNKMKGAGIEINKVAQEQFYRRSEDPVLNTLACIDFVNPVPDLLSMGRKLYQLTIDLFDETVHPYRNDPELIRITAVSRNTLYKHLNALKIQQDGRSDNGTNG